MERKDEKNSSFRDNNLDLNVHEYKYFSYGL